MEIFILSAPYYLSVSMEMEEINSTDISNLTLGERNPGYRFMNRQRR